MTWTTYLGQVDALEGDAVLLGRRGLGKQLQQREAVVKVHVLLDAVLLAERQQHVGPATCRRNKDQVRLHPRQVRQQLHLMQVQEQLPCRWKWKLQPLVIYD